MKFECNQQLLSKALNIVSKAVTSRTTIPILKGILLKIDSDGFLTMSASDLDLAIENKIKVENSETGSIVVLSKLFVDIIRKLPNEIISIEQSENNIIIKCKSSEFSIVGLSADEFPNLNLLEENNNYIEFEKEMFKNMIRKTSFSASIDESKGIITGLLIEMEEDSINMVAIDGYRMAIAREKMKNNTPQNIIISAKILNEISKILTEIDTEQNFIKIIINEKKAVLLIENLKIVLSLLNGDFIKYKEVLPKESKCKAHINRKELIDSIERASLLSKEGKNNLVKFAINETTLTINSKSEEGTVKEEISISKEGENIEIGFNAKYVLDAIKAVEDEEIVMVFNTSISPCLIEPIAENEFEYLILPVRINNN